MFGLGLTEIVVIVIVVLIVVKPQDLPSFFKSVGKSYGEVKKTCNDVKDMKDEFIKLAEVDVKKVAAEHSKKILSETAEIIDVESKDS
jgi:sec-independent protein translocase protein TatB